MALSDRREIHLPAYKFFFTILFPAFYYHSIKKVAFYKKLENFLWQGILITGLVFFCFWDVFILP